MKCTQTQSLQLFTYKSGTQLQEAARINTLLNAKFTSGKTNYHNITEGNSTITFKKKKKASFLNTYKALFPDVLGCCVYFLKCFQKYGYILRKW